jgi:hypothetical protein
MSHLLLILVLFSDPSGEPAAQVVSEELARIGGNNVEVVMGAEATKRLEGMGMKAQDLVVAPMLANHLTAGENNKVVIIRLDRRSSGGDEILESKVWAGGKSESHVAIAGKGGDPLSGALTGIIQVIGPRLPTAPDLAPSHDDIELAKLAENKDWKVLADRLDAKADKDPRQLYYLIMARARLGQPEQAREVLALMRTKHPAHFLTRAADTLIPAGAAKIDESPSTPAASSATGVRPTDDGSNVLRDGPAPQDDGGNVLR